MSNAELEDYKYAKAELQSTISTQHELLSVLVTASAALFAYFWKQGDDALKICGCILVPGLYAFIGALWLDQVYRQRRLALYIYRIEESQEFSSLMRDGNVYANGGWEHFIRMKNIETLSDDVPKKSKIRQLFTKISSRFKQNRTSRWYYYIFLALFSGLPVATYIFTCIHIGISVKGNSIANIPMACKIGVVIYMGFLIVEALYIISILKIGNYYGVMTVHENVKPTESEVSCSTVTS